MRICVAAYFLKKSQPYISKRMLFYALISKRMLFYAYQRVSCLSVGGYGILCLSGCGKLLKFDLLETTLFSSAVCPVGVFFPPNQIG